MDVEGCCLLCFEVKQELIGVIFIDSVQCNELNIKALLEKYFWTMQHIKPNSWLCVNCWTVINDFNKFYIRVKKIHQDYEIFGKKKDDYVFDREAIKDNEYDINNLSDNGHNDESKGYIMEFKETLNEVFLDCAISTINNDENLSRNDINPLLDIEVQKVQTDSFSLEQETKPQRFRKENRKKKSVNNKGINRICKSKISDDKGQTSKSKGIEINTASEKEVKYEVVEPATEILFSKQTPLLLTELEKECSSFENDDESKSETDTYSLNNQNLEINETKDMRNEKDKFLAENFKICCFLCEIPFDTFNNVLKHFKTHHTEPGFVQCCDKKFYRRNVLIDHVNYHLNPNYFKCKQCVKVFEDRRRLELHCASHEANNGKKFCCNICGKGFIKLGMLTAHKKTHITEEEKRFQCSECGKKFASNYMRANHCRTTHLKKYHKICEICGKSIQDKTIFERHMLQHEGKCAPSASCDICGLLLTDEKALERHKKVIHPKNGQKVYTCHICSKVSPNLRSHKLHVRFTHESGYNYKCSLCDKAYKRPRSLKEHMASHTGEILYTCPWCPKTFNSNANMHNHRKKIHPKEWEETSRKRYSGKLPPRFKPPTILTT